MSARKSANALLWQVRQRIFDLQDRALVMGILNVTPDSFSDGGQFEDAQSAVAHGLALAASGADILDVGGESTRPGAAAVDAPTEIARTLPVISGLRASGCQALISIDTSKAAVARAALEAGADILNDVTALTGDPDMPALAAASDCGLILMHMRGEPRTMQADPQYHDVVAEVAAYLRARLAAAEAAGIATARIAVDPGIGFGKTADHNLALLRATPALANLGRPLVYGVSRKSFLGKLTGTTDPSERDWPTVALTSYGREHGARIFRVHHVPHNAQALRMTEAILTAPSTDL
ncbi:dihydropteroate synthase [soil metagenome]